MSKMKTILISFLAIFLCLCFTIDGWYAYIYFFGEEKETDSTYIVGLQSITSTTTGEQEDRVAIELNFYDNLFEVLFTGMSDENQSEFFSQGLQFYTDSDYLDFESSSFTDEITSSGESGKECVDIVNVFMGQEKYYKAYLSTQTYNNLTLTNYNSYGDEGYVIANDTTSLDENLDYGFKFQIGNSLYKVKLKGIDEGDLYNDIYKLWSEEGQETVIQSSNFIARMLDVVVELFATITTYTDYYRMIDIKYFCEQLYYSFITKNEDGTITSTLSNGSTNYFTLKFGDIFDYYLYDEDSKQYVKMNANDSETILVDEYVNSYFFIKVNYHSGKVNQANQSLFNIINGNSNYLKSDSIEYDIDYSISRVIKNLTLNDFNPTYEGEIVYLSLNDEFISYYYDYKDSILLYIEIDLDRINELGYEFGGFIEGTFGKFYLYNNSYFITQNGITTEVAYG